jgi:hypothetical protein
MKGSPSALARRHAFPIAVFLFIATMRKIFSVWQTSSGKTRFVIDFSVIFPAVPFIALGWLFVMRGPVASSFRSIPGVLLLDLPGGAGFV